MEVPKLHVLVPKLAFWEDFIIVLKRFSVRNLKSTLKLSNNIVFVAKTMIFDKNRLKDVRLSWRMSPSYGPGPYGPLWAHMGLTNEIPQIRKIIILIGPVQGLEPGPYGPGPGPIWAHISDFWFNFARFGFKTEFCMKFLDDSAWFCVEMLKKHGFETK